MNAPGRMTVFALLAALPFCVAAAADFRTAADAAVVLYDAPSVKARKLYIVNRGYPLEVVVQVEGWIKVRDAAGSSKRSSRTACINLPRSASILGGSGNWSTARYL